MQGEYYKTKEGVEEYVRLSEDVSGKELIDQLNIYLEPNSSVLEIGSGPGTDWNQLNKMHSVIGSDNSEEFLRLLHAKFPNREFLLLDAVTLDTNNTRWNLLQQSAASPHK